MSNLIPAGEYAAKPIDCGGDKAKSGTPYVRVKFQITEPGPHEGRTISQDFYLTEKTWESTTKTLVVLGWDKVVAHLKATCIKPCSIVIEHEQEQDKNKNPRLDDQGKPVMRARVRWVNAAAPQFSPSAADELAQLLSSWGAEGITAGSTPAPTASEPRQGPFANGPNEVAAGGSDDDLPF